ncbi:MAG TPA: hypothetical protein VMS98_07540 [Thermoanaerobaculia bacterium]|nr:hypothetical protein [Thermoanaerobaculia bacterium]
MVAKLRKHYVAFSALAAFHLIFFFPVLFMGRVVSPNDVFYQYDPWSHYRPESFVRVQNALMNDPPTGYLPMMAMVRRGLSTFHWNPYVAAGIPGFGSVAAASLTPFILLPAVLTPLPWVYTAIIFLKVNVAFWFAYAWLREERMGKRGAAIGAIVIAVAGVYSVRWLWQMTNATALYPALLWLIRRAMNGKRTSIALTAVIALAYAFAGFPSAMAYGAYVVAAYAIYLLIRGAVAGAGRQVMRSIAGVILALAIAAPAIAPFAQLLKRSGYLETRASATSLHFPASHWRSFIDPDRLGNHGLKNWRGDPSLGRLNNYYEATIYVGLVTLPLAGLALFNRRARGRWFWVMVAAVTVALIFGAPVVGALVSPLPGFKYTALSRVVLVLPLAAGFLAAAGAALLVRRLRRVGGFAAVIVVMVIAGDLAFVAGKFHPYLSPSEAVVPTTPVIRFLQNEPQPFRFAGLLTYLWPNAAEMYGIQDVASHFSSEAAYRKLLQRIDPTLSAATSTVIQFNSLEFDFTDPLVSMLGVRYLLEHRTIDIIKWTIFAATVPSVKESGAFYLESGEVAQRTIPIGEEPFWAIEVPVSIDQLEGAAPRLRVELWKGSSRVWLRDFAPDDITALAKIYVPVHGLARSGDTVTVRLLPRGLRAGLLRGVDAQMYYGRVTIPIVFDRQLPDGRIFRNLGALPRFWAVERVRKLNHEEFLHARDIDLSKEAVITDAPVFPPASVAQDAEVTLVTYEPARQRIVTSAESPLFLASSEKLTPELRVTIDGKRVRAIEINTLFAGVNVPAGRHEVVFSRRIGRGWWPVSLLAMAVLVVIGGVEATSAWRRR